MIKSITRVPLNGRSSRLKKDKFLAYLLLFLAVLIPISNTLLHSSETSPIDEWQYIDYTDKVLSQGFIRLDEQVGVYTIEIMSCHGVIPGNHFGDCGSATAKDMPYEGHSQAAPYTPLYFGLTAIFGKLIQFSTGLDQLTSWRLTGSIWLALAIFVLIKAFRAWKIPDSVIFAVGLLIIASPYSWLTYTFVSTDAPSLLFGALILYLVSRIGNQKSSALWLLAAFPLAILFKVTNITVIFFALLYLLIFLIDEVRKSDRGQRLSTLPGLIWKRLGIPILAATLAVASEFLWLRFIHSTATPVSISIDQGVTSKLSPMELIQQSFNFLGSTMAANPILTAQFATYFSLLSWICVAGVVGAFLALNRWNDQSKLVVAILITCFGAAPFLALALQLGTGSYFQLAPRYGGGLVPLFMLSTAVILRNKVAMGLIIFYSVTLIAAGLAFSVRLA